MFYLLFYLHLKFAHNIPVLTIDCKSCHHDENLLHRHSDSLNGKFSHLFTLQKSIYLTDFSAVNQNAVVNLLASTAPEIQYSILKLNSNFMISKQPSFLQLIAPIEKAFKNSHLTDTQKTFCAT